MPKPKPQYLENGDPELMDPNELEMASGQNTQDPRLAFDPHVYQDPDGSISNPLDDWMVAQDLAKRGAGLNYGPKTPTPSPASVAAQPKGYEPPPQMTKYSQALTGRLDDQGQPVPYDPKDITTGPPQMKEPKWWQRALAIGAGGAAGFANAMGKRAPAIDVGSMGENILHPGYGEQMSEWKQRVAPLQAAAQIAQNQQQFAGQQQLNQSMIERNKAQGQYYSGQGRGTVTVTQAISDASGGKLPVGTTQPYQVVDQVLSQNKGTVVIDADTAAMTGLKEGSRQPTSIVSTQLKARSGMVQITTPDQAAKSGQKLGSWVPLKAAYPNVGKTGNQKEEYYDILTKQNMGQPLSPEETAKKKAYEQGIQVSVVNPGVQRAVAFGRNRAVDVTDDQGNVHYMPAGRAEDSGANAPQGVPFQYQKGMALSGVPTSISRGRADQAQSSIEAGNGLIQAIKENPDITGNIESYWNNLINNTPISDPRAAGLMARLESFAALQPGIHNFRSYQAMQEFSKMIGGLQKDPDALINAIGGLQETNWAVLKTGHPNAVRPGESVPLQSGGRTSTTPRAPVKTQNAIVNKLLQRYGGNP